MTLITQETLKELENKTKDYSTPYIPSVNTKLFKQLIHDAKVARAAVRLRDHSDHHMQCWARLSDKYNCTCGLSAILKELDELEKE